MLASVCHHTIAWTSVAIGPYPRTDPTTPLCCSGLEFNKLMANLTYHYCEFELMKEYHRLEIKIIRDPSRFHDAAVERNHHRRATRRLRDEYKSSARYHQEHDDPAFPVVNKRGAPLLPSLASLDEPFCQPTTQPFRRGPDYAVVPALIIDKHGLELPPSLVFRDRPTYEPETPETLRAAELLRKQKLQNRKTVKIAEGYRTYIQPTYIDGVPGHTLEILDDEPHPTRETARAKKSKHLVRRKRSYNPEDTPTRMGGIGIRW